MPVIVPLPAVSNPSRMRSRVVLPVPEGAMTQVTPFPAVKDTFSSTGTPSYCLQRLCT